MKAYDIQWDTDGKDAALPAEVEIPEGIVGGGYRAISKYLTELTGVHHNGYLTRDERGKSSKLPKLPNCPFCNGSAKRVASKFTPDDVVPVKTNEGYKFPTFTWYGVKCEACGIAQPKRKYLTRKDSDAAWGQRSRK